MEAYGAGDHERAVAGFLSAVSGLDWETCQAVLDEHVPGGIAQTVKDADTLFGVELPAISAWAFGPEQAAAILQPSSRSSAPRRVQLFVEAGPCSTPGSRRSRTAPSRASATSCTSSVPNPSPKRWRSSWPGTR